MHATYLAIARPLEYASVPLHVVWDPHLNVYKHARPREYTLRRATMYADGKLRAMIVCATTMLAHLNGQP